MPQESKKINIIYVVPEMNSGGVEQNVLEVANHLVNKKFNIFILTSSINLRRFLSKNVKIITMDVKTKNPFKIIANAFKIAKILKKLKIEIVHVKSRAPAISVYLARKLNLYNFKFISTIHGLYSCNNYFKYLYAKIMTKADKIITVSPATFDYTLNEYNPNLEKIKLINRGIDMKIYSNRNISISSLSSIAKFTHLDEDARKMFLFPARISKIKGHLILLKALSLLDRDDYCCMFMTSHIKDKKLKNEILNKIQEYRLEGKVTLIENVSDIKIAYFLSYFVISLSMKEESFGRIPLEAGSMFRPIIASNIGNYRKTIIHNKTGYLVEPFNHFDIADKINQALNLTQKEWIEFCKNSHDCIKKNYQIDQVFKQTEEIYKNIVKEK